MQVYNEKNLKIWYYSIKGILYNKGREYYAEKTKIMG